MFNQVRGLGPLILPLALTLWAHAAGASATAPPACPNDATRTCTFTGFVFELSDKSAVMQNLGTCDVNTLLPHQTYQVSNATGGPVAENTCSNGWNRGCGHCFGCVIEWFVFTCGADGRVTATFSNSVPEQPGNCIGHCLCSQPSLYWNASDTCATDTGLLNYNSGMYLHYTLPSPLAPTGLRLNATSDSTVTFFYDAICDIWTRSLVVQGLKGRMLNTTSALDWLQATNHSMELQQAVSSGTTISALRLTVTGLTPSTISTFRLCALNAQGTATCGPPVFNVATQAAPASATLTRGVEIGIGVVSAAVVGLSLALLIVVVRSRRARREREEYATLVRKAGDEQARLNTVWEINEGELKFERAVAEGANGVVWRAQYMDHAVAVKKLKEGVAMFDAASKDEFFREAAYMRELRHRNIVFYYGSVGLFDDFFVLI